MSEPSSFASLGPTLLARKGGAKPAMRPQVAPLTGGGAQAAQAVADDDEELEDLGWNDMGHGDDKPHEAQVIALTPMPVHGEAEADNEDDFEEDEAFDEAIVANEPIVRQQQREIVTAIAANAREPRRSAANDAANNSGRRAAFTLRLDARRHLKLRLASTVKNRSAQQLVTQALDQFLADIPEIDALAAQVTLD